MCSSVAAASTRPTAVYARETVEPVSPISLDVCAVVLGRASLLPHHMMGPAAEPQHLGGPEGAPRLPAALPESRGCIVAAPKHGGSGLAGTMSSGNFPGTLVASTASPDGTQLLRLFQGAPASGHVEPRLHPSQERPVPLEVLESPVSGCNGIQKVPQLPFPVEDRVMSCGLHQGSHGC